MVIKWTVPGEPRPKRTGHIVKVGGFPKLAMNENTRQDEHDFKLLSMRYKPDTPLTGPIAIHVKFYRAKGMPTSKKRRAAAERGEIRPITKPDNSNLFKMMEDALKGIFYLDDAQVVESSQAKFYSETPRTEVIIREMDNV